jgi:hypothetical protein
MQMWLEWGDMGGEHTFELALVLLAVKLVFFLKFERGINFPFIWAPNRAPIEVLLGPSNILAGINQVNLR